MKPRHIVFINIVFFGLALFSAATVYQFMTGQKPLDMLRNVRKAKKPVVAITTNCTPTKPIKLDAPKTPELKKLAVYQKACRSYVADTVMVFVSMPTTTDMATAYAKQDAAMLQDFAKQHVRPLVIAEPSDQQGNLIDFAQFAAGRFGPAIDAYFAQLQAAGLTDAQLGIWTPFPEANLPYWNNNDPSYFAPNVTSYLSILRNYFPSATTSVLLNSATYEKTDFNWENGEYNSLLPFVKGIPKGLVNYAGLQGFPWLSPQGGNGAILNAAEFLSPGLLAEMADELGTKQVWFNTGTFGKKYALDPTQQVTLPPERRRAVLSTITLQAQLLQKKGYTVAINLFAQDKSRTNEETDWSYWAGNDPYSSPSTVVFTDFVSQLHSQKVDFWLFDK